MSHKKLIFKDLRISCQVDGKSRSHSFSLNNEEIQDGITLNIVRDIFENGLRIQIDIETYHPLKLLSLELDADLVFTQEDKIFCNGFQSWSASGFRTLKQALPRLAFWVSPICSTYGDYGFFPGGRGIKGLFSWGYTIVERNIEKLFLFSNSEQNGYTLFRVRPDQSGFRISKDVEGTLVENHFRAFDILVSTENDEEAFTRWFDILGIEEPTAKKAIGYTSWYYHYQHINEELILQNLREFAEKRIPIDIFQIDDGYQEKTGDWLKVNSKFPSGMKEIAGKIKESNYKAGLWLAPFVCEKNSALFKNQPEWLLRDPNGELKRAGYNPLWSGSFYALDIYNEEVRHYLREVFRVVVEDWGFEILKLDFLYAVALYPTNGKNRAMIMNDALDFLRECAGKTQLLGCGTPILPAMGKFNYCRIGPDVHTAWDMHILRLADFRERISTENAIRNTICRYQLGGRAFMNDPDVFFLRDKKLKLSSGEKFSLLLANLLFGQLIFTSDDPPEWDGDMWKQYKSLFPLPDINITDIQNSRELYKIHFQIEERNFLAFINLSREKRQLVLQEDKMHFEIRCREFVEEGPYTLEPHESACYLLTDPHSCAIAGSNLHFFSGTEASLRQIDNSRISLSIRDGIIASGKIFLLIPPTIEKPEVNGKLISTEKKGSLSLATVFIEEGKIQE